MMIKLFQLIRTDNLIDDPINAQHDVVIENKPFMNAYYNYF